MKLVLIQEGDFVWHRGSTEFLDVQDVPSGEQFTNPDTYVNWIDETEPSGDDCVLLDCNDGELVKINAYPRMSTTVFYLI